MTKTVWAVMCGAYSAKYLAAVFTEHDRADAFARANDGYVDEYDLDPPLGEAEQRHLRPGEHFYDVTMDVDGQDAEAWEDWSTSTDRYLQCRINKEWQAQRLSGSCWATSEEHAIKILNERRGFWLAQGKPFVNESTDRRYDYGWRDTGLEGSSQARQAPR